jgi:hypothetical protein
VLLPQSDLHSASIENSAGVIGMQAFGRMDKNAFGAISLSESAANMLSCPLVAEDELLWSGIVIYNTSEEPCDLLIKPYTAAGEALEEQVTTLGKHGKLIGSRSSLQLPEETDHMQIHGTQKITGLMLVGNGQRMGGSELVGMGGKQGVLPLLEKSGWTSIVFVNHGSEPVDVTLDAHAENGSLLASEILNLKANERKTIDPLEFFASELQGAGYISFTANGEVGALQLNGSDDSPMFDLLPAL